MTKVQSLALVCAGPISRAGIGRLPNLADQLGPVKSGTLQRASRTVNSIGGGTPVSAYRDLENSRTVLINVPDKQLTAIVAELAAGVGWKHKIAVLCNSTLDSSELAPLEALGAAVGSFDTIAGFEGQRYVIEGSGPAIREMRALLQQGLTRVIEIRRGAKKHYLAGVDFVSTLLTSALVASVKNFRKAGIPLNQAHSIVAKLADKSVRDYLKAGVAGSPAAPGSELKALADGLEFVNPGLIQYLRSTKTEL
jgi:predicted short-subunit dehydrogenase-like oxidoreductase (DUF2520 family)